MNLKYNSLDVYFHMTNHYKKLRSVKSVVDTSSPVGYYERQSRPPSRAEHRRETQPNDGQALKIRSDKFKNSLNSSLDKKYEPTRAKLIRSSSVPSRPPTRRRLVDMPTTEVCPQRAKSSGPFVKEKSNIPKLRLSRSNRSSRYNSPSNSSTPRSTNQHGSISSRIKIDKRKVVSNGSVPPIPAPRKPKIRRNAFKNWIIEHDYMEFMLRITEDIIQNNLYTGEEILQVLNSHIEANVDRLSVPKMMKQIRILCYELNVPFEKVVIGNANIKTEFMEPLEVIQKSFICTCNSLLDNNNKHDFGDCECVTKRSSPFQCIIHNGKRDIGDLLKINQDFSPGKNIMETYFFKNDDDSANVKETTTINNSVMNDEESTSTFSLNPHSLSCVPELSEATEPSAGSSLIHGSQPQASQPSQIYCTSPKATSKHAHPCNCNKSKQLKLHTHTKFNKSSNGDEDQSQNNKNKIENAVKSITKQVTENVFHIGCPCSNPTEPPSIVTGPLDYVLCCTNVQHTDNKHQVKNKPFVFQATDNTGANQNDVDSFYCLPVTQKQNFYNTKENLQDKDEQFVMSLGTAYMPKSVSQSGSNSLFENVCIVAPDAKEKCKLILLRNLPKQFDPAVTESNEPDEISHLNSSYIIEAPQVKSKKIISKNKVVMSMKDNESHCSDKCVQLCSTATMTSSKCSSEAVYDKNKKSCYKPSNKTTQGATITDKTNKNIFLIVPDDVKHDQIFVVRKSQFEKLDTQSGLSHESEIQILKDAGTISQGSYMPSCMEEFKDAASYQTSICSTNPVHKIRKASNLKKSTEALENMDTSSFYQNFERPTNPLDNRSLKNYQFTSFSFGDSYKPSTSFLDTAAYGTDNCNSKILVKLNDYDLTPQRDNNSNCTSSTSKHIAFSLNSETSIKSYQSNKDKLLLGNEYELNKSASSVDYSKGIPDSIKQFYPNTASQTGPSDGLSLIKSSMTRSNDLEPKTNSNSSIESQEKIDAKSQSTSSVPNEYQTEVDPTDSVSVLKQITDLQLDLLLDFELTSEEQNQENTSVSHNTNIIADTLHNQDNASNISSSTSVLEELLVSKKSVHRLEDPTVTSLASMKIDESPNLNRINITQIVDDNHDEEISINKKSDLILPKQSNTNSQITDSQLSLLFANDDTNIDSASRRTTDSLKNSIKGSKFRFELNQLIEKSNNNSDIPIEDSSDVHSEVSEILKTIESSPQHAQQILNIFDDDEDDDDNDDCTSSQKENNENSIEKSSKSDINVVGNEPQPTYEIEKPSFKRVESKVSIQNAQRRVLIKEQSIIDRKESFVPFVSTRHDSAPIQLPFIQVEPSDPAINISTRKRNSSNDSTQTSCCGLKSSKAKMRRDVIEVDKNLQTVPNISAIPDDQLFEVEMRRPTNAGYGPERKSLRFDYSMMSELSGVGGEQIRDGNLPKNSNNENTVQVDGSRSSTTADRNMKSTLDSSLIDIYKPARDSSCDSFMMTDSFSLKEKNNETLGINDF